MPGPAPKINCDVCGQERSLLKSGKKADGKCAACGTKGKMTKDHIIPLSRGGTDFAYNLQPMCLGCNIRKATSIAAGTQHSLFDRIAV